MGFLSVTIPTSTSDLTCPSPTAVQSGVSSPTFISSMIPDVKGLAVEDGSHDETIGAESALASGFSSVQSVISFASTEDVSDPTVQNRCYWIDDNMVVLLVEGQLFRIHSHFLKRESEEFRDILTSVSNNDGNDTSENAILLHGVTSNEFKSFVAFFDEGMYHDYNVALDEWISILSVATHFGFARVRERAAREINSARHQSELDPVQKIVLARKFDILEWLAPCYEALCQRPQGLENDEAEVVGATTTNCVWKAREALQRAQRSNTYPARASAQSPGSPNVWNTRTYDAALVSKTVLEVFWPPSALKRPAPSLFHSSFPDEAATRPADHLLDDLPFSPLPAEPAEPDPKPTTLNPVASSPNLVPIGHAALPTFNEVLMTEKQWQAKKEEEERIAKAARKAANRAAKQVRKAQERLLKAAAQRALTAAK